MTNFQFLQSEFKSLFEPANAAEYLVCANHDGSVYRPLDADEWFLPT